MTFAALASKVHFGEPRCNNTLFTKGSVRADWPFLAQMRLRQTGVAVIDLGMGVDWSILQPEFATGLFPWQNDNVAYDGFMATFAMIFTSLMLLTVAVLAVGLAVLVNVWSALGFLAFWGLAFLTFGRRPRRGRVGRAELNAFQRSLADD